MCASWFGKCREMSPDRNSRYQIDNVGLQIGLGLPINLLGVPVSLMNVYNSPRNNGNRGRGGHRRNQYRQNPGQNVEVQHTCDGIPIRKIYITNISIETQRAEIKNIFYYYGQINQLYMGVSKNDKNKQFAFITFVNPLDAARVLSKQRFQDEKGRTMFAVPADSWHQPRELPDGTIDWRIGRKTPATQEDGSEDEVDQTSDEIPSRVETEINEGSLNILNDDCLLHIFSFLSYKEVTAVERVCKRWQALSYRMWRCLHELHFRKDGPLRNMPFNTKVLEQYLKRCGASLTTLDLITKHNVLGETTLAIVAKHCNNLEVLQVNNLTVANRSLAHLGRSCPRLKKLVMDSCERVSDNDLNALLPKCPDLRILDLSNIDGLTGRCLANIQGPVTHLRLSELSKIDPQSLIKGLEKMSPTLEALILNVCSYWPRRSTIVKEIVTAVPNLLSLTLSRCLMVFDSHSLTSLGQLKNLRTLNLDLNNAVNDITLSAIVEGCEELVSLNLSGSGGGCAGVLSERGLSVLSRLRKLLHLNISYLEATSNTALKNITARNYKLKSLVCRGCPELNDEGTETVVTLCNELELFDLSGCNGVSDKTAETALTSVKMRTNNTPLTIIVGGTHVNPPKDQVSLLTMDFRDLSEDHLRPDFIDDMFFPPSDSDDDEDLDHLCERIGCDCDFEFDDLFDPTVVDDETRMFAVDYDDDDDYWPGDFDTEDNNYGDGAVSVCDNEHQWDL